MNNQYLLVKCNHCDKTYKIKSPEHTKKYKCKNCGNTIVVQPKGMEGSLQNQNLNQKSNKTLKILALSGIIIFMLGYISLGVLAPLIGLPLLFILKNQKINSTKDNKLNEIATVTIIIGIINGPINFFFVQPVNYHYIFNNSIDSNFVNHLFVVSGFSFALLILSFIPAIIISLFNRKTRNIKTIFLIWSIIYAIQMMLSYSGKSISSGLNESLSYLRGIIVFPFFASYVLIFFSKTRKLCILVPVFLMTGILASISLNETTFNNLFLNSIENSFKFKMYKNDTLGFSIKIPSDFKREELLLSVAFFPSDQEITKDIFFGFNPVYAKKFEIISICNAGKQKWSTLEACKNFIIGTKTYDKTYKAEGPFILENNNKSQYCYFFDKTRNGDIISKGLSIMIPHERGYFIMMQFKADEKTFNRRLDLYWQIANSFKIIV